jgi:glycosyltransferase involved in cell wall biosynthesis
MANQTRQLAELLRAGQALVELVQTNRPYSPPRVARLPGVRAVFRLLPYLWALWRAAGKTDVFHIMANSGWSWHLFATPAIWIASLRGVPVLVNYRGGGAEGFLVNAQWLVRRSMRRVAILAVPSRFLHEIFARFGMPAEVVPNIIDLVRFRPRDTARAHTAHLVVARNLEPVYDNATALRAFHIVRGRYPSAQLTIAGSGPEMARLRELAEQLGLQDAVHFPGRLDREAMAALFRQADIMLNPSLTDNMPNSVLESLASGVPVVSTNVGGVPHVVQDGVTALLVPPAEPAAMAQAILALLGDPGLWRRISAAGLAEVQRYGWPQVAPLLAQAYRAAMRPSPRQPV